MAPRRVATALFVQSQQPRKRALKHLRLSSSAPEMLQSPTHPKQIREKEDTRSRKWREMAVLKNMTERGIDNCRGGGVEWSFMVKDPKLISRTWKGIPDCWRGAAWHAFLTASAKTRGIGKPDTDLVTIYYELLERPSSDDVQIDLDVPRTINSHIMFRRRYRGGQRLLFRVLHSLALYSPEVGYVQGMASLAATLLCYYDEEITFVMLVRLWELRGLEKLYKSGFGGLMDALEEFENRWMKGNQINKKLTSLGVSSTAYGTRWYLTLFNYSIPFPAQLRVWDVFMLLGDPDLNSPSPFCGTLDVLHATSAAILDGMKSIILKSDFEDAMKNLTSFLPVKDEDMLMKVAKAEWKMRKRK
ncbi:rab-GTPase-TBC domain-containing protein [Geopyxis carbonaria]|nr:rab-GTPase-TBC domain-containing protein [Geopyxis carbonaria]